MEHNREQNSVRNVDILQLRQKGLTIDKISTMLEIPVKELENHLHDRDLYKTRSGVL